MDWGDGAATDTLLPGSTPLVNSGSIPLVSYGATEYPSAKVLEPPSAFSVAPRPSNFHTMSLGILIALPVAIFVLISLCLALLYHQHPGLCWVVTIHCQVVAIIFMLVQRKQGSRPNYWFNLGVLCFVATMAANAVGLLNFRRHFALYWAYEGQRDYTNVLPSEPAVTHLDAGKIFFSVGAHVDTTAAVGLTDGERFCVAPIVGSQPKPQAVEYWAAGVDCCDSTGQFTCGEIANKQARAGLVYLDYGPRRNLLPRFQTAAREAGGSHGTMPSSDALFVSWVEDPDQAQLWYRNAGMAFLTGSVLIHLAFSVVIGFMIHFGSRAPAARSKLAFAGREI